MNVNALSKAVGMRILRMRSSNLRNLTLSGICLIVFLLSGCSTATVGRSVKGYKVTAHTIFCPIKAHLDESAWVSKDEYAAFPATQTVISYNKSFLRSPGETCIVFDVRNWVCHDKNKRFKNTTELKNGVLAPRLELYFDVTDTKIEGVMMPLSRATYNLLANNDKKLVNYCSQLRETNEFRNAAGRQ